MSKDYIASFKVDPDDKLDYGVPGMKWGKRRSRDELRKAAAEKAASDSDKPATTKKPSGPESSADRYRRLLAQAQKDGANSLDDDDLKFVNARRDAIAKINKIAQQNPNWLADTAKKVLQQSAQAGMQEVADALRRKHITGPLITSINGKSDSDKTKD